MYNNGRTPCQSCQRTFLLCHFPQHNLFRIIFFTGKTFPDPQSRTKKKAYILAHSGRVFIDSLSYRYQLARARASSTIIIVIIIVMWSSQNPTPIIPLPKKKNSHSKAPHNLLPNPRSVSQCRTDRGRTAVQISLKCKNWRATWRSQSRGEGWKWAAKWGEPVGGLSSNLV